METNDMLRRQHQRMTFEEFLEGTEVINDVEIAAQMPNHQYQMQRMNAADFLRNQNPDLLVDNIYMEELGEALRKTELREAELEENVEEEVAEGERVAEAIRWNRIEDAIPLRIEALNRFANEVDRMMDSRRFSVDQVKRRVDAILRVWERVNIADEYLEPDQVQKRDAYNAAIQRMINRQNILLAAQDQYNAWSLETVFEKATGQQIRFEDGEDEGFPAGQEQTLHEADQWLLEAYAGSKNSSIENSMIFSFFNRFKSNRLLAYYMIENGYRTDITEATVVNIKNTYTPNVEKLRKAGLKLSDFEEVYQSANQAAPFLRALYIAEVRHQDGNRNEEKTYQQMQEEIVELDEHMNEVLNPQQKIEAVYDAINNVTNLERKYRDCSYFNLIRKRSLKNDLKKALEDMGKPVNELMTMEIHLPGEDKTTVQEYVMGKLQTGKLLGTGSKSGLAIMASSFKLEEMKPQAAMSNYAGGAIGAVTGLFGAVLAVGAFYRTFKNFSNMTWGAGIGAMADAANQMISSGYGVGAALTGTMGTYVKASQGAVGSFAGTLGSQTAAIVTAGTGILVGGVSTGVGLYQYGRALNGVRKGKAAKKEFNQLKDNRKVDWQTDSVQELHRRQNELARKEHFERNILKIQERIVARDAITAGCQTVSGICVMAASAMSLFSAIPVMGVIGAGVGAAGFLIGVGGSIVSKIKKSRDYEKAVDDFLELEQLAEQRIASSEDRLGKKLGRSEKKKIKEQLRREMMEAYGYTSAKAFCAYIMNGYAAHIHNQMEPIWTKLSDLAQKQKPEDVLTEEEGAYLAMVKSLGLKVSSFSDPPMPTQQMIFEKLMR